MPVRRASVTASNARRSTSYLEYDIRMRGLDPITTQESISERVYNSVRDAIISQRLAPASRVTEASLAAQLSVSKTPVREALLKLEYIGLIEFDGKRGGRVISPSRETLYAAYQLRIGLESQVVRILAERARDIQLDRSRDFAEHCLRAAENNDRAGFREYDQRFHISLADATGLLPLQRLVRDAYDLTSTLRRRDVPDVHNSSGCAQQHLLILDAIESGSPHKADNAIRFHLDNVQRVVLDAFEIDNAVVVQ